MRPPCRKAWLGSRAGFRGVCEFSTEEWIIYCPLLSRAERLSPCKPLAGWLCDLGQLSFPL